MSSETQFIVTLVTIGLSFVGTIVSIVVVGILLYRLMQRYIDQRFEESNRRDDELKQSVRETNQRVDQLYRIVSDLSQRVDQRFDGMNQRVDQRFDGMNQRIGGVAEDVAEIKGALGVIRDAVPLRVTEQQP